ncbi:MAG: phosphoribosylglycinamide formyltransferase [Planctomycetota bacterium]|nr:phosphoribosylglycinamide formyltransferase [Planctomycetota bacterium]
MTRPGRIAFLLSGSGSTLRNLLERIADGTVPAEVVLVVSDRPDVGGLEIARAAGIEAAVLPRALHRGRSAYGAALGDLLAPRHPDLVVSGGFLTIFDVPADLAGRVVNVHPSLLPAFGGKGCWGHHVHEQVLAAGVAVSGCTVHQVTNEVDGGPILAQAEVAVHSDDTVATLAERVQAAERELYPRVIAELLARLEAS